MKIDQFCRRAPSPDGDGPRTSAGYAAHSTKSHQVGQQFSCQRSKQYSCRLGDKYFAIAFFCGLSIMVMEILASRILAPYIGTSLFSWTAIIGIVMAGLAVGYSIGGKIADKHPKEKVLSLIIFFASLFIFSIPLILDSMANQGVITIGTNVLSIFFSFILFFAPSTLLGMVAPFLIRLGAKKIEKSGENAGGIFAVSTIGSIIGTFLAGFVLIPNFGVASIIYFIGILLFIQSAVLAYDKKMVGIALFFLIVSMISQDILLIRIMERQYSKKTARIIL